MSSRRSEIDRRTEEFAETCRALGLKLTHQRLTIFRELAGSTEHPDAETIYQSVSRRVSNISRDTVYRTLAALESHGLIQRTETLGGPTRYDARGEHHHHFICTSCGRIFDFFSAALDDLPIPDEVRTLGEIDQAQVQVRGLCAACARRKRSAKRS